MIKQLSKLIVGSCLLIATSFASASLIPMTWHDEYKSQYDGKHNYEAWTFDLGNDGFDTTTDYAYNYKIQLDLGDDEWDPNGRRRFEFAFFNQPGVVGDRFFEVDTGTYGIGASLRGIWSINKYGTLSVSLKRKKGDFYFFGAELWAKGKRKVPEPGLLSLLALGLVGVGLARRRSAAKA